MIQIYPNPLQVTGLTFLGQPIRNSPLSTYSYVSSTAFDVSVYNDLTNSYSSAFVYKCGDPSAWAPWDNPISVYGTGVTGASNYQFSPWKTKTEAQFNYLNFGCDSSTRIKVGYKKGNISSVDIGPYKKNFNSNYSYLNSSSIEISGIQAYDKLIVNINNDLSTPLYVFANPIQNIDPTSVNLYLSAGIWEASAVNYNLFGNNSDLNFILQLSSNWDVYLAPGCYLDGTLSVRDCSNVNIFGPGVIDAGRPYIGNWWSTVGFEATSVFSDSDKLKRAAILAFSSFTTDNAYEVTQRSKNIRLYDVTMVNSITYAATVSFKEVDNAKVIAIWSNCDGFKCEDVSSTDPNKFSSQTRTFVQSADDTCYVGGNHGNGSYLISGCYFITLAGCTFRSFFGQYNQNNYIENNNYWVSAIDIDCRSYAVPGYAGVSVPLNETFTNAIFGLIITDRKRFLQFYSPYFDDNAIVNHLFSDIRVENLLDLPVFDVGIKSYPEPFRLGYWDSTESFGTISSIIFKDITVSSHPNSKYQWTKKSKIFADEINHRVHDVSFINVTIDNKPITNINKDSFIHWENTPTVPEYDPTAPSYIGSSIVDVYLLIGDSIADALDSKYSERTNTTYSSLPSEITGCYIWVPYQYTSFTGTWPGPHYEVMRPGVNIPTQAYYDSHVTGTVGLESTLAWKLRQNSNRDIYFIKYAQPGALAVSSASSVNTPFNGSMPTTWSVSATGPSAIYPDFSGVIVSAINNLKNQYKNIDFKGGVICLGTNVPIQAANYLVLTKNPDGSEGVTGVNSYKDVALVNSLINTEISSLTSGIQSILKSPIGTRLDLYYSNFIWVMPIAESWGGYDAAVLNSYTKNFSDKVRSFSSIDQSSSNLSSIIFSLKMQNYFPPTGAPYLYDGVHYNFSGIAKITDDLYQIFEQQTSSVTDPSLNPEVNYQFSLHNGMKNWVKIDGEWKEGDAWIKKNGEWKFVTPTIKLNNSWK